MAMMPEILTPEHIAEMRACADAATPGPWIHRERDGRANQELESQDVLSDANGSRPIFSGWCWKVNGRRSSKPNAIFMAAARTYVPALIASHEALRADRDELETLRDAFVVSTNEAGEFLKRIIEAHRVELDAARRKAFEEAADYAGQYLDTNSGLRLTDREITEWLRKRAGGVRVRKKFRVVLEVEYEGLAFDEQLGPEGVREDLSIDSDVSAAVFTSEIISVEEIQHG